VFGKPPTELDDLASAAKKMYVADDVFKSLSGKEADSNIKSNSYPSVLLGLYLTFHLIQQITGVSTCDDQLNSPS
jgi:hypothetical protein